jgi:hypothetical protein
MREKLFPQNIHPYERVIRIVLGIVLLSLIFVGPKTWWGLLGLIPLVTGLTGSCLPYKILGINTRTLGREKKTESKSTA